MSVFRTYRDPDRERKLEEARARGWEPAWERWDRERQERRRELEERTEHGSLFSIRGWKNLVRAAADLPLLTTAPYWEAGIKAKMRGEDVFQESPLSRAWNQGSFSAMFQPSVADEARDIKDSLTKSGWESAFYPLAVTRLGGPATFFKAGERAVQGSKALGATNVAGEAGTSLASEFSLQPPEEGEQPWYTRPGAVLAGAVGLGAGSVGASRLLENRASRQAVEAGEATLGDRMRIYDRLGSRKMRRRMLQSANLRRVNRSSQAVISDPEGEGMVLDADPQMRDYVRGVLGRQHSEQAVPLFQRLEQRKTGQLGRFDKAFRKTVGRGVMDRGSMQTFMDQRNEALEEFGQKVFWSPRVDEAGESVELNYLSRDEVPMLNYQEVEQMRRDHAFLRDRLGVDSLIQRDGNDVAGVPLYKSVGESAREPSVYFGVRFEEALREMGEQAGSDIRISEADRLRKQLIAARPELGDYFAYSDANRALASANKMSEGFFAASNTADDIKRNLKFLDEQYDELKGLKQLPKSRQTGGSGNPLKDMYLSNVRGQLQDSLAGLEDEALVKMLDTLNTNAGVQKLALLSDNPGRTEQVFNRLARAERQYEDTYKAAMEYSTVTPREFSGQEQMERKSGMGAAGIAFMVDKNNSGVTLRRLLNNLFEYVGVLPTVRGTERAAIDMAMTPVRNMNDLDAFAKDLTTARQEFMSKYSGRTVPSVYDPPSDEAGMEPGGTPSAPTGPGGAPGGQGSGIPGPLYESEEFLGTTVGEGRMPYGGAGRRTSMEGARAAGIEPEGGFWGRYGDAPTQQGSAVADPAIGGADEAGIREMQSYWDRYGTGMQETMPPEELERIRGGAEARPPATATKAPLQRSQQPVSIQSGDPELAEVENEVQRLIDTRDDLARRVQSGEQGARRPLEDTRVQVARELRALNQQRQARGLSPVSAPNPDITSAAPPVSRAAEGPPPPHPMDAMDDVPGTPQTYDLSKTPYDIVTRPEPVPYRRAPTTEPKRPASAVTSPGVQARIDALRRSADEELGPATSDIERSVRARDTNPEIDGRRVTNRTMETHPQYLSGRPLLDWMKTARERGESLSAAMPRYYDEKLMMANSGDHKYVSKLSSRWKERGGPTPSGMRDSAPSEKQWGELYASIKKARADGNADLEKKLTTRMIELSHKEENWKIYKPLHTKQKQYKALESKDTLDGRELLSEIEELQEQAGRLRQFRIAQAEAGGSPWFQRFPEFTPAGKDQPYIYRNPNQENLFTPDDLSGETSTRAAGPAPPPRRDPDPEKLARALENPKRTPREQLTPAQRNAQRLSRALSEEAAEGRAGVHTAPRRNRRGPQPEGEVQNQLSPADSSMARMMLRGALERRGMDASRDRDIAEALTRGTEVRGTQPESPDLSGVRPMTDAARADVGGEAEWDDFYTRIRQSSREGGRNTQPFLTLTSGDRVRAEDLWDDVQNEMLEYSPPDQLGANLRHARDLMLKHMDDGTPVDGGAGIVQRVTEREGMASYYSGEGYDGALVGSYDPGSSPYKQVTDRLTNPNRGLYKQLEQATGVDQRADIRRQIDEVENELNRLRNNATPAQIQSMNKLDEMRDAVLFGRGTGGRQRIDFVDDPNINRYESTTQRTTPSGEDFSGPARRLGTRPSDLEGLPSAIQGVENYKELSGSAKRKARRDIMKSVNRMVETSGNKEATRERLRELLRTYGLRF